MVIYECMCVCVTLSNTYMNTSNVHTDVYNNGGGASCVYCVNTDEPKDVSSEGTTPHTTSTDGHDDECNPVVLQFLPSTISANSKYTSKRVWSEIKKVVKQGNIASQLK